MYRAIAAREKTEQMYHASIPSALPDVTKGIRVQASRPTPIRHAASPP